MTSRTCIWLEMLRARFLLTSCLFFSLQAQLFEARLGGKSTDSSVVLFIPCTVAECSKSDDKIVRVKYRAAWTITLYWLKRLSIINTRPKISRCCFFFLIFCVNTHLKILISKLHAKINNVNLKAGFQTIGDFTVSLPSQILLKFRQNLRSEVSRSTMTDAIFICDGKWETH